MRVNFMIIRLFYCAQLDIVFKVKLCNRNCSHELHGVVGVSPHEPDKPLTHSLLPIKETPLINRVGELALLREAADKAMKEQSSLFFLYGEAGIGKTRLTKELRTYVRSHGMRVLYGKCPSLFRREGVPPYVLWKELIRNYMHECSSEDLIKAVGYYPGEIYKLVPEIAQKLEAFSESPPLSPEVERDRLFEAVSQFVTNISKLAPLLVVLDDLQWADQSSLLLFNYVTHGFYQHPLMFVGAYRDIEVEEKHPLFSILTDLNRERLLQSARLKRLSIDEVTEMIKHILLQDNIPREFCKLVYEKTRGNPFFVEEVLASLLEDGIVYPYGVEYRFKEVSEIDFPETVRSVLQTRLSRLDEESKNVLMMASFLGNDFNIKILSLVTGFEENQLLEIMDRMMEKRFLKCRVVRGEDKCSFSDALIRDVLYESVGPLKRKKIHGVVASALETAYAKDIDEHLSELATHFLESGNKEKAYEFFLKAGEKAAKVYANNEAVSYYETALNILEEKNNVPEEKARILEDLGDLKALVGDYDDSLECWNAALLIWTRIGEQEKIARLHRISSNVLLHKMGNTEKAKEHQSKALEILQSGATSVELANLQADMAHMYWHIGDSTSALPLAEEALEAAKRLNSNETIANSYLVWGKIAGHTGDLKRSHEGFEKALEIALENNYAEIAVEAYKGLARAFQVSNEMEKRLCYLQKGYELAKKVGAISAQSWIGNSLAEAYFGMGKMEEAHLLSEESVTLDRKTDNLHNLCISLLTLADINCTLGEYDVAEKLANESLDITKKQKIVPGTGWANAMLGMLYFRMAEYAKSREYLEKAIEILLTIGVGGKTGIISLRYVLIWNSIELGELEKAEEQLNVLQPLVQQLNSMMLLALAAATRGMLLRAQKKWDASIEYFEKTLEGFEALRTIIWNSRTYATRLLYEYARVYLERDLEGDREKARNLLTQALVVYRKLKAKKEIEKIEAILANIERGRPIILAPQTSGLVATGYLTLDQLLYGGIYPGFAIAVTSPPCDERDSLIRNFLESGSRKGELTFYLTTDPELVGCLSEEFPSSFNLFVCNPQAEALIRKAPNIFTLKGVENLTNINIILTQSIRKLNSTSKMPRRICIDLISDIMLQHGAIQTRKWLSELLTQFRSSGFTTLAIISPQMHSQEQLHAILGLFDGEITIKESETEQGFARFLSVRRYKGQKYLKDERRLTEE